MPPAETRSALREALALHRRGELADAERAYRRLIDDGGASGDAEHMLGLVLHQLGRSEEALDWLERARLRGGAIPLWVNLASALLALGRAGEAESYSLQALSADPSHAGANLNLGLAREAQRRYPEAIDTLERAVAAARATWQRFAHSRAATSGPVTLGECYPCCPESVSATTRVSISCGARPGSRPARSKRQVPFSHGSPGYQSTRLRRNGSWRWRHSTTAGATTPSSCCARSPSATRTTGWQR
ncbi:MAG: tetratricopeptide repeat protein [Betaproteobacteria bacterium]|nr:tetratricopeptide repeat protein [Betaproteobacteria bacterium]